LTRAYAFDENGKNRADDAIRWVEGFREKQARRQRRFTSPFDDIRIYNDTNEELPQYGVARVTGINTVNDQKVVTVEKPSTTFGRLYLVNSGDDLAYQRVGVSKNRPVVKVLYDTGTPAIGETWGPAPSQWTLKKGYPGFLCLGIVDATSKIMLARYDEPGIYLVKADADISKGSTGTASLYYDDAGTETDTTINIADCKALGAAITGGKWALVQYINGVPIIGPFECS
jgi:hypothetical protein